MNMLLASSTVLWSQYTLYLSNEPGEDTAHLMFRWFAARRHLIGSLALTIARPSWLEPAASLLSLLGPYLRNVAVKTEDNWGVANASNILQLLAPLADAVEVLGLSVELCHWTEDVENAPLEGAPLLGPSLHRLTALEFLKWDDAQLFGVGPRGLGPQRRLGLLDLAPAAIAGGRCGDLGRLTALQTLELGCCGEAVPPADLAFLTALQLSSLTLTDGGLRALPPELTVLSDTLVRLNLTANHFEDPSSLEGLQTLTAIKILTLNACRLQQLPPQLPALTSLLGWSLSLNHFPLTPHDVRVSLAQLTRLTDLYLCEVDMESIEAQDWLVLARACPALTYCETRPPPLPDG